MEGVNDFNRELRSILDTHPPVSRQKMALITKSALKVRRMYKHLVLSIEKFIQKAGSEYKIPGLYVMDAIMRQSRHQFGVEKDVFAPRFLKNLIFTFLNILKCDEADKHLIVRVLNLWQKNEIYSSDIIQVLLSIAEQPCNEDRVRLGHLTVNHYVKQFQLTKHNGVNNNKYNNNNNILSPDNDSKFDDIITSHNVIGSTDQEACCSSSDNNNNCSAVFSNNNNSKYKYKGPAVAIADSSTNAVMNDYGTFQNMMLNDDKYDESGENDDAGSDSGIPLNCVAQFVDSFKMSTVSDQQQLDQFDAAQQLLQIHLLQQKIKEQSELIAQGQVFDPAVFSQLQSLVDELTTRNNTVTTADKTSSDVGMELKSVGELFNEEDEMMKNKNNDKVMATNSMSNNAVAKNNLDLSVQTTHQSLPEMLHHSNDPRLRLQAQQHRTSVSIAEDSSTAATNLDNIYHTFADIIAHCSSNSLEQQQCLAVLNAAYNISSNTVEDICDNKKPIEDENTMCEDGELDTIEIKEQDHNEVENVEVNNSDISKHTTDNHDLKRSSKSKHHHHRKRSSSSHNSDSTEHKKHSKRTRHSSASTSLDGTEDKKKRSRSRHYKSQHRRRKGLPLLKDRRVAILSKTIWIGHLHKNTTWSSVQKLIEDFGDIDDFNFVAPRGCAFVTFVKRKYAARAINKLSGTKLDNKILKVAWAPNKGVNERDDLKGYWDEVEGATYIPEEKFPIDHAELDKLLSGGADLDEESMTDIIRHKLMTSRQHQDNKSKQEHKDTVVTSPVKSVIAPTPLPSLFMPPSMLFPPPFLTGNTGMLPPGFPPFPMPAGGNLPPFLPNPFALFTNANPMLDMFTQQKLGHSTVTKQQDSPKVTDTNVNRLKETEIKEKNVTSNLSNESEKRGPLKRPLLLSPNAELTGVQDVKLGKTGLIKTPLLSVPVENDNIGHNMLMTDACIKRPLFNLSQSVLMQDEYNDLTPLEAANEKLRLSVLSSNNHAAVSSHFDVRIPPPAQFLSSIDTRGSGFFQQLNKH